jgi:predicted dehydrogenase
VSARSARGNLPVPRKPPPQVRWSGQVASRPARSYEVGAAPRLGFLGLGWIGRKRLESLETSGAAEIVAVADPAVADALDTYEELLEHELDGVVIATPSAFHAQQAIAALERGVAVFCQKPLGRTAAETSSVVAAARQANRLLATDFCYRHVEAVRRVRELVRRGELGRVHALELAFHNSYGPDKPWFFDRRLSGGGCVIDLGTHLIDLALWLLDRPAVEGLESRLHRLSGSEPQSPELDPVEDYAVAQLDLSGPVTVRLACSWHLPLGRDAQIEVRVFGERGGAHVENVDGSFYDFAAYVVHDRQVKMLAEPPDDWGGRAAIAWARQLATSHAFDAEVEQVVEVARVIDAIYDRKP